MSYKQDIRTLRLLSASTHILIFVSAHLLATFVPLFDTSPLISLFTQDVSSSSPLLRWDAFHFAHLATHGARPVYEHEWAFFPGTPMLISLPFRLLPPNFQSTNTLLYPSAFLALLADVSTTTTLYDLTLHHFPFSRTTAFLAALLSLLPSSVPTVRFAVYSEPFFAWASYKGMLACARKRYLHASIYFALAGTFRSNGILLGGFVIWDLVIEPWLDRKQVPPRRLAYTLLLTFITFLPFTSLHLSAYLTYCLTPSPVHTQITVIPQWCSARPFPSIYTHVQAKYWNQGLFRYWTLAQLPNFALAAPVYALLGSFGGWYVWKSDVLVRGLDRLRIYLWRESDMGGPRTRGGNRNPFLAPSLTPHVIHALVLTATILFTSHVQIMLRLAGGVPVFYWAGVWLVVGGSSWVGAGESGGGGEMEKGMGRCGKWWVGWSVVWGAVSLVLWVAFLPPA